MMQNTCRCSTVFFLALIALLVVSLIKGCEQPAPPLSPTISASPSSFDFSAEQGAANPSNQTLEIQNSAAGTLAWSITDDAHWLTLSPANASSTAETNKVTVSVNIAGLSPGDYSATITISAPQASNSPQEVPVNLVITPLIPTAGYAVSVAVSPMSQTGLPGDTLDYTLTVTNRGTEADTYDLSITSHQGWTLTAPSATSEIASVASEDITINLTIPQDAVAGTEDEITIIATSQSDATASDSAVCTAVVIEEEEEEEEQPPPSPASVSISPGSVTVSPGDTFTIEVIIDSAKNSIQACHVEIAYDSDVLTASTVTEAGLLDTNILTEPGSGVSDGLVKYGLARISGNPAVPVSGTFVSITFELSQTAPPGNYSLDIEAKLRDENLDEIAGIVGNDGVVTVQ